MEIMKSIALLLSVLCIVGVSQAQSRQAAPDFAKLERIVMAELAETNTPGAALGIVSGDRLIYAKGFGVSNIETGAAVTPDMLFRLGSTTKMFTAAGVVLLAGEGKLKMDAPIATYTKGLNPKIGALTAHQLLSHTSGLRDEATMFGRHDDDALGETVRGLKDDFFFAAPGRIYSYSNPGYWLAGYLIEAVSGGFYADELDKRIFKPLGMERTTLRPTTAMTWPLAQGHASAGKAKPTIIRPAADNAGNWPAGSIFSSVNDLSRWVIALMNEGRVDGKQVLPATLFQELSKPRVDIPGGQEKYGYGLGSNRDLGALVVSHSGARAGYGSMIGVVPESKFAVIVLVNRTGGGLPKTVSKATEMWLGLKPKAKGDSKAIALTAAEMAGYAGVYGAASNGITLAVNDGVLWYRGYGAEGRVRKVADSRFQAINADGSSIADFNLISGPDGKAEFLHMGGRTMSRQ
jgi:CubicO group peptidase (beta-lactamase class C family)